MDEEESTRMYMREESKASSTAPTLESGRNSVSKFSQRNRKMIFGVYGFMAVVTVLIAILFFLIISLRNEVQDLRNKCKGSSELFDPRTSAYKNVEAMGSGSNYNSRRMLTRPTARHYQSSKDDKLDTTILPRLKGHETGGKKVRSSPYTATTYSGSNTARNCSCRVYVFAAAVVVVAVVVVVVGGVYTRDCSNCHRINELSRVFLDLKDLPDLRDPSDYRDQEAVQQERREEKAIEVKKATQVPRVIKEKGDIVEKGDKMGKGANVGHRGHIGPQGPAGLPGATGAKGEKGEGGGSVTVVKEKPRPLAHITGIESRIKSENRPRGILTKEWRSYGPFAKLMNGFEFSNGQLKVPESGMYYVYSQVYFRHKDLAKDPIMTHFMYRQSGNDGETILTSLMTRSAKIRSNDPLFNSYTGGVFYCKKGDLLMVGVSEEVQKLALFIETFSYFGAYLVER
eukprot:gene11131-12302_t